VKPCATLNSIQSSVFSKPANSRQSSQDDSSTPATKMEYSASSPSSSNASSIATTPASMYSFNSSAHAVPLQPSLSTVDCLSNLVSELNQQREHNKTLKSRLDCEMKSVSLLNLEKRDLLHRLEQLSIQNHLLTQRLTEISAMTSAPSTHGFPPAHFFIKQQAVHQHASTQPQTHDTTNGTMSTYHGHPAQHNAAHQPSPQPNHNTTAAMDSEPCNGEQQASCGFTRLSIQAAPSSNVTSPSPSAAAETSSTASAATPVSTLTSEAVKAENG